MGLVITHQITQANKAKEASGAISEFAKGGKQNISKKILQSNDKVDINKFSKKPGSGPPRWIGSLGYELVKDLTEHKGPAYKLFQYGKRIATITLDGTILGK